MNKEIIIKENIVIMDGNKELMNKSLANKKNVLAAIKLGENIKHTVDIGWSDYLQAHAKLKGETKTGTCFCGKPATHLVYFWR